MALKRATASSRPKPEVVSPTTANEPDAPPPSRPSTGADAVTLDSFLRSAEAATAAAPQHDSSEKTVPSCVPAPLTAAAATKSAVPPRLRSPRRAASRSSDEHGDGDGDDDDDAAAIRTAQYRQNWSQVVLGATSGIMFVLVAWVSYALYCLVTPYYYGITNGMLLSIVMHPQSRLRSALYMGTAVERMRRQQRAWAAHGRLAGILGAWLSLRHFASFVLMQVTFLLGLNKISVASSSFLLGSDRGTSMHAATTAGGDGAHRTLPRTAAAKTGKKSTKELASAGESRVGSPQPQSQRKASTTHGAAQRAVAKRWSSGNGDGSTHTTSSSSDEHSPRSADASSPSHSQTLRFPTDAQPAASALLLNASVVLTPVMPASAATPAGRRLVATARGRRVLRYLTLGVLLLLVHLLVGLEYFALLHGALGALFAVVVPFADPETFVRSMGRLWRVSVVLFLMVGLSTSLYTDYTTIVSAAHNVSAGVVGKSSWGGEGGWMQALGTEGVTSHIADARSPFAFLSHLGLGGKANAGRHTEPKRGSEDAGFSLPVHRLRTLLEPLFHRGLADGHGSDSTSHSTSRTGSSSSSSTGSDHGSISEMLQHLFASGGASAGAVGEAAQRLRNNVTYVDFVVRGLLFFLSSVFSIFDTVYATALFVFVYRFLIQLDHTVLYYGVVKLLRVIQPEVGDHHARNIEHDITVSFVTLLQSFWHLTWFHFCVTFCAFALWGMATPFLLGLVSVLAALFPLVPKWLSPCSIACVYTVIQLVALTTAPEVPDSPFFVFADGNAWTTALVFGKPYLHFYARTLTFAVATLLEVSDEWLLCVSRGLRGGFVMDAAGNGREQLQPFVIGTAIVLGFVAYGIRGIVLGPLTVIVARVLYDNWDIVLSSRDLDRPPSPLPTSLLAEEEGERKKRHHQEK